MNQKQADKLYMDMARRLAEESSAVRSRVGSLLVKDDNIISYGWNGTPHGFDNACETEEEGKLITKPEVIHAEQNVISKLVRRGGVSTENSTLYLTLSPCASCAALIIQCKISRVVYFEKYRDEYPLNILKQADIDVVHFT